MTKKRVLFVDDEPNILSGLKRMLRSMRDTMEFFFADRGAVALAILADHPIDVIVSDMRMPGMDGAELLQIVRERHPGVIRIMLTGQADNEAVLRTVGVVHQFLAKPSDPQTLKEVLNRATTLKGLMTNESLKGVVSRISSLPSLPSVYAELQACLRNPDASLADVAEVIEKDMGMSTKILQLVNSAFFGLFKSIDSIARAVNLLGLDTIKALVLGFGVFTEFKAPPIAQCRLSTLWQHSLHVAHLAKAIAVCENQDKTCVDLTFISGIIHDIGKLVMASSLSDQYQEVLRYAGESGIPICAAEEEMLGACHADIGGYLVGLWGLPGLTVEAVVFHHRLDQYPDPGFSPAVAIHAADAIYYQHMPKAWIGRAPELDLDFMERAGLTPRIDVWQHLSLDILGKEKSNG